MKVAIRRFSRIAVGQGLSVIVGVAALRGNTEAFSSRILGTLSLFTLALSLLSNALFVPPLQVALRNRFTDADVNPTVTDLLLVGEARAFAVIVAATLGVIGLGGGLLDFLGYHASVRTGACMLWLFGSSLWALLKTDLSLRDRNDAFAFANLAAGIGPQFFAGGICLMLGGGVDLALQVQAVWLVLSALACGLIWRISLPVQPRWFRGMTGREVEMEPDFIRSATHLSPLALGQWALQSAPRWCLAAIDDIAGVGRFSALWSPMNQAYQVSVNTVILSERPRFYRAVGSDTDALGAIKAWVFLQTFVSVCLAVALVVGSSIWQRIALASSYRVPGATVALLASGQILWSLALVGDHTLLVWDKQWLSSAFAGVAALVGIVMFFLPFETDGFMRAIYASIAANGAYLALNLVALLRIRHTRRQARRIG